MKVIARPAGCRLLALVGSEDSLVVVEFLEDGDGPLVRLTHSGFASDGIRAMHDDGWKAVVANLKCIVFS